MKIGPVMAKPQFFWPKNAKGGPFSQKNVFSWFWYHYGYQCDCPEALISELYKILLCSLREWRYWQKYAKNAKIANFMIFGTLLTVFLPIYLLRDLPQKNFIQIWNQCTKMVELIPIKMSKSRKNIFLREGSPLPGPHCPIKKEWLRG